MCAHSIPVMMSEFLKRSTSSGLISSGSRMIIHASRSFSRRDNAYKENMYFGIDDIKCNFMVYNLMK